VIFGYYIEISSVVITMLYLRSVGNELRLPAISLPLWLWANCSHSYLLSSSVVSTVLLAWRTLMIPTTGWLPRNQYQF